MTEQQLPAELAQPYELVSDPSQPLADRVAFYAVLQQLKLRIERRLREVKHGIAEEMLRDGEEAIGPVSVAWSAVDVTYSCNEPDNWTDAMVQDTLRDVVWPVAPEYVRHIPDHLEIDAGALGRGVAVGDPVAIQLHRELDRRGWRHVGRRVRGLKVKEPKGTPKR
jgi:hypothetical protein